MGTSIVQVDAFTDRPFAGNPAGVCLLPEPRSEEWMQSVASEMNLSETAFLVPSGDAFDLRWFTPVMEVDLCGHATLASAHMLWEDGHSSPDAAIQFDTHSGRLTATRAGDWIELDFPATAPEEVAAPEGLAEALGAALSWTGRSKLYHFVEVSDELTILELVPDFAALSDLIPIGVIVTSRAAAGDFDFVSRFFAPGVGIDEDPVTGSAHCALAPYWHERLGKADMVGYQASTRGGVVRVSDRGDRVLLGGQAVTVLRAELV